MANLVISGDTSGSVTLAAPAVSGTTVLTLPTTTGTLVVTGGAQTIEFADGTVSAPSITNSGDTNTGIYFPAADTIAFTEGGVESMRIDSVGNVGIGTSSPGEKLQVNGNIKQVGSGAIIYQTDNTNTAFWGLNPIAISNSFGVSTGQSIPFIVANANTERMRIDSSGNVGIGTSSPDNRLLVNGSLGVLNESLQFRRTGETTWGMTNFASNLYFNNGTDRMIIDSSGNLLVGTTTANGKISSNASFNPTSTSWATIAAISTTGSFGGAITLIDGTKGYAQYCTDFGNDFYIQGSTVGSNLTGGVFLNDFATSWSSASDENVKDIIEPITNGLEKVASLRTVIGKYKNEKEGKRHPFLIAQDVQAVLPEAVSVMHKGSDNECLALSYTDVIPLLVASIKELNAKVTALEKQLGAK
jgi:hypothetical protein